MKKIRLFIVALIVVLVSTPIFIASSSVSSYDPWLDLNDDGVIDVNDLQILALIYATSGIPINKTALLLELQARLNSLNASLLTDYYNKSESDLLFVDASGDAILGYLDVDSGTLYVNDVNDRVGIGTTTPGYLLDIYGSTPALRLMRSSTSGTESIIFGDMTQGGRGGIYYYGSGGGTDYMAFKLAPAGTNNAGIERVRIDGAGNVGIGTTSPYWKTHIATTGGPQILLEDSDQADGSLPYVYIQTNAGELHIGNANRSAGNPTNPTDRITMDSSGNVGIGTSSPTEKLDVNGNLNVKGSITMNTVTRYYSIPATAWLPNVPWTDLRRFPSEVYLDGGGALGNFYFFAEVNLPHGAVVTELRTWAWDNAIGPNVNVTLFRLNLDAPVETAMAEVATNGAKLSWWELTDSTISEATIDNQDYTYIVRGCIQRQDDSNKLSHVRITYTVTEPLP